MSAIADYEEHRPHKIQAMVLWVWLDAQGNEWPMEALVPSPTGGAAVVLTYPDGSRNAEGYDVIARRYARSGRVKAYKRRYFLFENMEKVDGTSPTGSAGDPGSKPHP